MTSLVTLLAELEALEKKATPAPWGEGEGVCGPYLDYQAHEPEWDVNCSGREPLWLGGCVSPNDRKFIATLRNAFCLLHNALRQEVLAPAPKDEGETNLVADTIRRYLSQLAPHVSEREAALLLEQAAGEIELLERRLRKSNS